MKPIIIILFLFINLAGCMPSYHSRKASDKMIVMSNLRGIADAWATEWDLSYSSDSNVLFNIPASLFEDNKSVDLLKNMSDTFTIYKGSVVDNNINLFYAEVNLKNKKHKIMMLAAILREHNMPEVNVVDQIDKSDVLFSFSRDSRY